MTCPDAVAAHLAVAEALTGVWTRYPSMHQAVHAQLGLWGNETYEHTTAAEHLEFVRATLRPQIGREPATALDSATISEQPIDEVFELAAARVFPLYGQPYPPAAEAAVVLEVAAKTNPVYPDAGGFGACGASACYGRDLSDGRRAVRLTLCPALLGPPTLATVPYLVCHELICHAFQNADHASDDPFAEGWMDRVALALHQAWSDELFPQAPQLAREEANTLSQKVRERWHGLVEPHMTTRAARLQGWYAAGYVQRWLEPFAATVGAPSSFERLSIQMNTVALSVAQRKKFVADVLLDADTDKILPTMCGRLRAWTEEPSPGNAAAVLAAFTDP